PVQSTTRDDGCAAAKSAPADGGPAPSRTGAHAGAARGLPTIGTCDYVEPGSGYRADRGGDHRTALDDGRPNGSRADVSRERRTARTVRGRDQRSFLARYVGRR